MDQEQAALTAQIVVTVLVFAAFGLSLGAGISALKKWREHRARVATYDIDRVRAAEFMAKQSEEHRAFTKSHPAKEWDAFFKEEGEKARAAGFAPKTIGEFDLDNFVGERPEDRFQAPREVGVGLAALIIATVASIIDIWLT